MKQSSFLFPTFTKVLPQDISLSVGGGEMWNNADDLGLKRAALNKPNLSDTMFVNSGW